MAKTTVAVRMYNMGFGDAFRVTVRQGRKQWRMLVDCGAHSHGAARPLTRSVEAIVADLAADGPAGGPKLDVVVATHHHADHIAGFALDPWEQVEVAEVWVPFVEDRDDPDAIRLRQAHTDTARRLQALVDSRTRNLDPGRWPPAVSAARAFSTPSATPTPWTGCWPATAGRSPTSRRSATCPTPTRRPTSSAPACPACRRTSSAPPATRPTSGGWTRR